MNLLRKILSIFLIVVMFFNITYAAEDESYTYDGPTLEEIKSMSMNESCGLTVEELEKGLLYDLKPLAKTYIEVEGYVKVNAVIKAAQDALESDWGRNCFKNNNISGFFTENGFDSKSECIYFVGEKLHLWYLTPPEKCKCNMDECPVGQYYNGETIYDVSISYCPTEKGGINEEYGDLVCEIAYQIYQRALSKEV